MCSVLFKIPKAFFFKSRYRSSLKSAVTDANGRYVYYLGPALFRDLLAELRKMAAKLRPENCRRWTKMWKEKSSGGGGGFYRAYGRQMRHWRISSRILFFSSSLSISELVRFSKKSFSSRKVPEMALDTFPLFGNLSFWSLFRLKDISEK